MKNTFYSSEYMKQVGEMLGGRQEAAATGGKPKL
jgi:hypothetical protein